MRPSNPRSARSLTVLCRTREPGERVRALLAPLRSLAEDVVVALESGGGDLDLAPYADVADRVVRFEHGAMERSLAWLHAQCRGDWILILNGDEVCGPELIAALPELMSARDALQYSFTLRWLWPDPAHWLAADPWHPDFHVRLVRNDATLRFLPRAHDVIRPVQPHRFCELPLWQLGLILNDEQQRRARGARDWANRVSVTAVAAAGDDVPDPAFLVPEERRDPLLEAVTGSDHEAIWRVLAATPPPVSGPQRPPVAEAAPPAGARTIGASALAATITPLSGQQLTLRPGELRTLYLRVRNDGDACWPWGLDQPPLFRMGYRWHGSGSTWREPEPEGWAPFPCDVPPGEERIAPVQVTAPDAPGRWELEIDVALHGERWFGSPAWFAARVI